ncbi:MAG: conjugal transfer protein TrbI [Gammaproteobacteria bacterium]|jgi:intracellular multiplication protein IcmE|nr:conjugal transfer protein TrbI [Gammaproteobacteria bacterium]
MQIVKSNLAKLSNYPRLRVLLIILGLILLFIIGMNLFSSGDTPKPAAPPSAISPINTKTAQPVASVQKQNYDSLANKVDTATTQQEITTGRTVFSNVFGGSTVAVSPQASQAKQAASSSSTTAANGASNANNAKDTASKQSQPANARDQNIAISPEQAAQEQSQNNRVAASAPAASNSYASNQDLSSQQEYQQQQELQQEQYQQQQAAMQQQQAIQQLQQSMSSQLQGMQSDWKLPTQSTVAGSNGDNSGASSSGSASAPQGPVAIKAGTIMFAVVQTALDSDQPGTPVMATIVTGPYTGALLLGNFKLSGEKLVVTFNQMSLKSQPSTVNIGTAYAIDSQTANNAVETSVDNHYLLRYGMLFAASFLQGFGSAYQNYTYTCPPGTSSCTVINSNGTPSTSATTQTAMYQGFGQVGTNLGQVAASQFNTPPTVTLAQGTGIGVLFMNDVRIP